MLDEMTAALPANLTERVLEVIGRQRGGERSVIFISHRMIEIAAVCDRATVLREGETVGVVDVTEGSEERIVELMLGHIVEDMAAVADRPTADPPGGAIRPRIAARDLAARHEAAGRLVRPVPGRGARRGRARGPGPGRAVRHPGRLRAPDQRRAARSTARRSPSATRPTPSGPGSSTCRPTGPRRCSCSARCARTSRCRGRRRMPQLGPRSTPAQERPEVDDGDRPAADRHARQGEVRRLSGGNQQKVTIARWVAGGVHDDAVLRPDPRHRHPHQAADLRAAARPGRGRRRGPAVHLGAQGDPARLRPGDRHLRRPGGRRDRGRGRRRAGAAARGLQPEVRRARCPRRSPPRWSPPRPARRKRRGRRRPTRPARRPSRAADPETR